jgi:hypothetical protein
MLPGTQLMDRETANREYTSEIGGRQATAEDSGSLLENTRREQMIGWAFMY